MIFDVFLLISQCSSLNILLVLIGAPKYEGLVMLRKNQSYLNKTLLQAVIAIGKSWGHHVMLH
jgi:hypothetical protein